MQGDLRAARALYAWNAEVTAVLAATLGHVEVLHRATRGGRIETPGRVVAELNFGFWRYLLAGYYDNSLWREALYRVFPGQPRRRAIHDAAEVLHLARNRLAHHEPMFNRPIGDIHGTAMEFASWICPITGTWIEGHCRTGEVLRRRPATAPAGG